MLDRWQSSRWSGVLWLISVSPITSQELNPVAWAKVLGHLVPRVEDTAWGWFHRAATTSPSWQWKDHEPVPRTLKTWPAGLWPIEPTLFVSCFGIYIFCELVKAYNNFNTVKEKNLHFVLLLGFRWKACKRVTWTLRPHLVHEFKHMFSIFKQYNMYFHTLFLPHIFPKKLKIVV